MKSESDMAREYEMTHEAVGSVLSHRILGRTGQSVSILGLGGGGLFFDVENRDKGVQVVNRAIDLGVNYLDTAPGYGASEAHYGEVLKTRRDEVFLATKVHPRGRDEAWQTIENSIRGLQTDHIDLIQVHDVKDRKDMDRVMSADGSLSAILEAREQGIVRWIGITGHVDPDALIYGLERFDFDTVLMPVNVADRHYLSFIDGVLPVAQERDLGVIAMKVYCAGGVFDSVGVSPSEALRYALSFPVSTAIIGVKHLDQLLENIEIARRFKPMDESELAAIENRTRENARICSSKFKRER